MHLVRLVHLTVVGPDDSRVALTFHFWSGVMVTYQVTESGDSVTGTTA
ncbi:hypothetical protein ACW4TU_04420 [Streptomyces sp. QTS52]